MATYAELLTASENETLRNKIRVGCFVAADIIRAEGTGVANHTNRLLWAKRVYENPTDAGQKMLWAVLASNRTTALAAILGATDAEVQTAITSSVDVFATGS